MALENTKQLREQFKNGVFPVDYLVLIFSGLLTVVSLLFFNLLNRPVLFAIADISIIITLLYLIFNEKRKTNSTGYWLHSWLPVISFAIYYTQVTSFDHLIFRETFDPLLLQLESALFGNLHQLAGFPGKHLLVDELMHFFYFSYYFILFIPGMIMFSRRSLRIHEIIFSLTLMMFIHFLFFILFPADGPLANHDEIFSGGAIFVPLMNFIYKVGGDQGGGAIPSTHVAVSVMIFIYCFSEFKKGRWLVLINAIGIIIATVYCSYHYIIDALAGLITGTIFYFIGKNVYLSWDHPAELPDEWSPRR